MNGVFLRWWIEHDHLQLAPAGCVAAPASGMTLTGQVVDLRSLATIFYGFSAVALIGSHEPDAAMAVQVGCTSPRMHRRSPAGINRSAGLRLHGAEQRL